MTYKPEFGLQWQKFYDEKQPRYFLHCVPLNDDKVHVKDGYKCWCKPTDSDMVPMMLNHNAADGREAYFEVWAYKKVN